jgi:hypothetical protein
VFAAASACLLSGDAPLQRTMDDTVDSEGEDEYGFDGSDHVDAGLGAGWKPRRLDELVNVAGLSAVVEFVSSAIGRSKSEAISSLSGEHRALVPGSGIGRVYRVRAEEAIVPRGTMSPGTFVVVRLDHLPAACRLANPDTRWFECCCMEATSPATFKATDPTMPVRKGQQPMLFDVPYEDTLISPASASGSQIEFVVNEVILALFRVDPSDTSAGCYPAQVLEEVSKTQFKVCFEDEEGEWRIVAENKMVRNLSMHEDEVDHVEELLAEDFFESQDIAGDDDDEDDDDETDDRSMGPEGNVELDVILGIVFGLLQTVPLGPH